MFHLRKKFNQYHLWEVKWKYRLGCGSKPSHGVFYGSESPTEYDTLIDEYFDFISFIPRNKVMDRFIRKSTQVHDQIYKNEAGKVITVMPK